MVVAWLLLLQACDSGEKPEYNPVQNMYDLNEWRHRPFDNNWKFYRGAISGAERVSFNDDHWRVLDLPHDWSIEDLPAAADTFPDIDPPAVGPFTPASPGGLSTGFMTGGIGWYRKAFKLDTDDLDKIVYIRFDGVYMNTDVWINGHHLGNHPYGYTPFYFNLTPFLKPAGETNIIAVQVKNIGRNSRWYSGSGIYRHVWLDVVKKVHLKTWGMAIKTEEIKEGSASVKIKNTLENHRDDQVEVIIETVIIDPEGDTGEAFISQGSVPSEGHSDIEQIIEIKNPRLWSPASPDLYQAQSTVYADNIPVDRYVSTFGIRTIHFNSESGFLLNGEPVLLRGGNLHHDNGPLGSVTIDRAEYRKVEIMKDNGFNAIRASHNPPSTQLLDACDLYGILVMDEAFDMWQLPKNPGDYHLYFNEWWRQDLESMVLRDRNHPSVIMWSIGNEIRERADSTGLELTRKMYRLIKDIDETRPVTAAICSFWDNPGKKWEDTAPVFTLLDIGGYNYQWRRYAEDHNKYPQRIIAGTESVAMEAYEYWDQVKKNSYVIGDFIWTAMDYLGEASIGHAILSTEKQGDFLLYWPWFNSWCGDIDLCGFKKPQSYSRDIVWGRSSIEILVHAPLPEGVTEKVSFWGWPDEQKNWNWDVEQGQKMKVAVYSSHENIRLFLNDEEIITKTGNDTVKYKTTFEVPYAPGELKAIGMTEGHANDSAILVTTGNPSGIRLTPDRLEIRPDRNDLCYVTVEICDSKGDRVPDAELKLDFEITGNGTLAAVGNGNPKGIKSFQSTSVTSFKGRGLVILRPSGERGYVRLTAAAEGLEPATVNIQIR